MAVPVLVRCDLPFPTSSPSRICLMLTADTESTKERPGIVAQTAQTGGPGPDWRPRGRPGRQVRASLPSISPPCARRHDDRAVRYLCPHGHASLNGRPFRSGLQDRQPLLHPACYPTITIPARTQKRCEVIKPKITCSAPFKGRSRPKLQFSCEFSHPI
jgi:hypothetical protein